MTDFKDLIYGLHNPDDVEYEVVTDPKTGHSTLVEKPAVFKVRELHEYFHHQTKPKRG
jgi:hypothetical protein